MVNNSQHHESDLLVLAEDISDVKEEMQHVKGTVKAIDAGYDAITKAIIKNCDSLLAAIEKQGSRIALLENKNAMREGRESFIGSLIDKWPLIAAIGCMFVYIEHGSVTFKNPMDKEQQSEYIQNGN